MYCKAMEIECNSFRVGRRYAGRGSAQGNDTAVRPVLMKVWDQPSKQEEVLEKSIGDLQVGIIKLLILNLS